MINLFHINNYTIDTSKFSNLLHDSIVQEFECAFAEYVGAKYACSANSASSLLFIALSGLRATIHIPSTMPIAVPNVIVNSGNKIKFYDDVEWVGHNYELYKKPTLIDSAQEVTRSQYKDYGDPNAVMIFSFYPTKPGGGCDGGMVVSDNKNEIDEYRIMTLNGTKLDDKSWNRTQVTAGHKMHATSIQAYIANENLKKLDHKNERLTEICDIYNKSLGYNNTSRHLYRIRVPNNKQFISEMKQEGISCGIHYPHCHDKQFYGHSYSWEFYCCELMHICPPLPLSEQESETTVSLPFHESLTNQEIDKVIQNVRKLANL